MTLNSAQVLSIFKRYRRPITVALIQRKLRDEGVATTSWDDTCEIIHWIVLLEDRGSIKPGAENGTWEIVKPKEERAA